MKKSLLICFPTLVFLLLITWVEAADCKPTISWSMASQFYVGETSKLIATINNNCDKSADVKIEVNTEKTYGYIKVYRVMSEDTAPRPKLHSDNPSSIVETSVDAKDTMKIIYFIQPDEMTLPGKYNVYENFYVDNKLENSREISINVLKPLQLTYSLSSYATFNQPKTSSVSIANRGFEMIESLKICLSSPIDVVSFSEECKTWEDIPSNFIDKFDFTIIGLKPGKYEDSILVGTDYTTYTGVDLSESYYLPIITITAQQTGTPSLSYVMGRGNENLTIQITNQGEGSAYDSNLLIYSPISCKLDSGSLSRFTGGVEYYIYELEGKNEILSGESFSIIFTYNSSQATPPCTIRGSISYKDGSGNTHQKDITNYDVIPLITTTVPGEKITGGNYIYIVLVAIIAVIAIVFIFFKIRRKKKRIQKNN